MVGYSAPQPTISQSSNFLLGHQKNIVIKYGSKNLLPLLDRFRTINWRQIQEELGYFQVSLPNFINFQIVS
jgi:hypothetical protein